MEGHLEPLVRKHKFCMESLCSTLVTRTRQLFDISGLEGGLLARAYPCQVSPAPAFCLQGPALSIHSAPLWPVIFPTGVHRNHDCLGSSSLTEGGPCLPLYGQHLDQSKGCQDGGSPYSHDTSVPARTWVHNKYAKEPLDTHQEADTLGSRPGRSSGTGVSPLGKAGKNQNARERDLQAEAGRPQATGTTAGVAQLEDRHSAMGRIPSQAVSMDTDQSLSPRA